MAVFDAQIILDVRVEAPNEAAARAIIKEALQNLPSRLKQTSVADTRLKEIKPDDGRLIAHLPNAPRARVIAMMAELSNLELLLYGTCAKPQTIHALFAAAHKRFPTVSTPEVAQALAALKMRGWLAAMHNHVELDVFPNTDTRAQFSALAGR